MGKTWKVNVEDDWKVEERFRNWGKPLKPVGDSFADWALRYKKDYEESLLENELKELFIKEMHERE